MWQKVGKDQIKSVPVGSKIRVCGIPTTLTSHYPEGDDGFNMKDAISVDELSYASHVFAHSDWDTAPFIEVWKETDKEECLNLEDAIKAFEEKHNITIKDWEENNNIPETIRLGQIMKVGKGVWEELVMFVQVDAFKYNLMGLVSGNRLLKELNISRRGIEGFSTKEIEKEGGLKIIELLDNPFKDSQPSGDCPSL